MSEGPDPYEHLRRRAAAPHAAGLAGLTLVGWLAAAAYAWLVFTRAQADTNRSLFLLYHALQAFLFHVAAFVIQIGLIFCAVLGFLFFAGDIPGLPTLPLIDLPSPFDVIVAIGWLLCGIGVPCWYLASVTLAIRAARLVKRGDEYRYPVIGDLTEYVLTRRERTLPAAVETAEGEKEPSL